MVHLVGLYGFPAGLAAMVDHNVEVCPGPELPLPIGDGGERGDDQKWPFNVLHEYLVQECDGLDGLPKPHFISQDTVTSAEDKRGQNERLKQIDFTFSIFTVTKL